MYNQIYKFLSIECDLESILKLTDDKYFDLQVKYDM